MKADMDQFGRITLSPETNTEAFALTQWAQKYWQPHSMRMHDLSKGSWSDKGLVVIENIQEPK